jgi:arsenical pump membrane protein
VAIALIVAVSIALMLIRPREIAEVWWVGAGALLLVLARLVPLSLAVHAVGEGADVYFFLLGMMLLSQLASEHGVFDWLSGWTIRSARGSSARLFTLVYGAGTVVTIFLSNDATAVVLTPAILAAVKRAEVAPRPHLFVCAFIANAASFVLPISNPANLVVFQHGMPSLGRWLASFALPSLLSITATYGALRLYFRSELRGELGGRSKDEPLPTGGRWVVGGLALVVVVLLVASAFNVELGLPTLAVAGVVTAAVSLRTRRAPWPLLREISWSTLLLVAALFVLVDAVESVGALALARGLLARASSLPAVPGALLTAAVVAVANNLVNNLPLGLIAGATIHAASPSALLTHSILVGIDLGPNLSITGSLATILWLLALRKGKVQVGFLDFFKVGAIAMPAALIASIAGLLLLHAFGLP